VQQLAGTFSSLFEADDQNAAYEVFEGAKKKDEDWNPEDNGGFAVHGTFVHACTRRG
jgi:hypothetical protein